MPHSRRLMPILLAVFIAPAVGAQDAPDRSLDENPYKDEKPRPIPDPRAALIAVRRPVTTVSIRVGGVIRPITFESPEPPTPVDDGGLDEPEDVPLPAAERFDINTAIVEKGNFDRWLFGGDNTEQSRLWHLEGLLRSRIDDAAQGHLTDEQRAKLGLAGRGDIKRYPDRIGEKRSDFESSRMNLRAALAVLGEIDVLCVVYKEGPFGEQSLFARTLARIETDRAGKGPR